MICKNSSVKIISDYPYQFCPKNIPRIVNFPDGIDRVISVPIRVWGWYDEFLRLYPHKIYWFKSGLLDTAHRNVARTGVDLETEIRFGFRCLLGKINRKQFAKQREFLTF